MTPSQAGETSSCLPEQLLACVHLNHHCTFSRMMLLVTVATGLGSKRCRPSSQGYVVAVEGDLSSPLRGAFDQPGLSLATISSSMVASRVVSFHSDSGTFLLTVSRKSAGILLIKMGHRRFPHVSSFTFNEARLLMWMYKRHKTFTFREFETASTCSSASICLLTIC